MCYNESAKWWNYLVRVFVQETTLPAKSAATRGLSGIVLNCRCTKPIKIAIGTVDQASLTRGNKIKNPRGFSPLSLLHF